MTHTRYRICCDRRERRSQKPCWFVEKSQGLDVVDTTPLFPTKFAAMFNATKRWPDLSSAQELMRLSHG